MKRTPRNTPADPVEPVDPAEPTGAAGRRAVTSRRAVLALAAGGAAAAAVGVGSSVAAAPERGLRPPHPRVGASPLRPRTAAGLRDTAGPAPAGAARPASAGVAAPPFVVGTTLDTVATPAGSGPYRRLRGGRGWPRVVRTDLAAAGRRRGTTRRALTAFVQLTDLHVLDVQHPLRFEYLRTRAPEAWRPQEALTVPGAVALIERVNALPGGPATGAPLECVVTTGDNTDNNSQLELAWFLRAMSGGRITPDSGLAGVYEGVQNSGNPLYWHPGSSLRDGDKARHGFPRLDGFLAAALRPVDSPGLTLPWFSTVGNHDTLPGGCYGRSSYLADVATGDRKLLSLPAAPAARLYQAIRKGTDPAGELLRELYTAERRRLRPVTPDPRRAPFTPAQYVAAHLDPAHTGAGGPVGHGYTRRNLADGTMYYTFPLGGGVLGVSLDTTHPTGHFTGSMDTRQLRWLERTLKAHRDEHVIVFSHHPSWAMGNTRGGRHDAGDLLAVLRRHRNVVAWVNGHSHRNAVTPHGDLWEVTTASHVDYPQLARIVELTDNGDGTLSLFTTLVESAAPHRADHGDLSPSGLAALYRELASNAPGARKTLSGAPGDRNTELLLRRR
ncbi:TIGR03767 family metallophosphoesterase [Streptomyces sp. NPDC060194]|uniref:TIGR03767 family metallophosphoesterase n=1 Tax=Streptomyces sp. NPDC060194 TaxID=3347069 RepID=UPI003646E557